MSQVRFGDLAEGRVFHTSLATYIKRPARYRKLTGEILSNAKNISRNSMTTFGDNALVNAGPQPVVSQ